MNFFFKAFFVCSLFFLFLFFYPDKIQSRSKIETTNTKAGKIIINEIAWMGTENPHYDEWIELYNNSSFVIDLEGWKLKSENTPLEIELSGKIPALGFLILERTDDTTLPDIKADLIYKGNLKNKGEKMILVDQSGEIIEEIDCSSGWFSGDNNTKQTMERKNPSLPANNPESWQSSKKPGGTPNKKNSEGSRVSLLSHNKNKTLDQKPQQSIKSSNFEKSKPIHLFLIALGVAIICGGAILFLKTRRNKN